MDIAVQKFILDQVRSELREYDTSKYDKSSQKSQELRKNGNNCFCKGNYEESLKFYNQSLLSAPLNSKEYCFALANRAAAFYHLSRFSECLEDIKSAFEHDYPLESASKLLLRQSACEKNLKDNPTTINVRKRKSTSNHFLHPEMRLFQSNDRGKGFQASNEIAEGSIILIDKPLVNSLLPEYYSTHCYHCLRYLHNMPFPCKNCNQVAFCDKNCATKSWNGYHSGECKYLDNFHFTEQFHYSPKMALKILLNYGINSCIDFHRENQLNAQSNSLNGYDQVYFMAEHLNDTNDYRLFTLKIIAFLIEIGGHSFDENEFHDLQTILMKHFRQILVNAIAIHHRSQVPSTIDDNLIEISEKEIGCGLYTNFRILNHSCKPNTMIINYDGDVMTMETIETIKPGQELLHAYGVHYKYQVKTLRQKLLKETYFFDCNCDACANDLQPINKAFLCPDCKGPVICDGTICCVSCKKKDHIDVQKILQLAEPCIKLIQIEEFKMAENRIKLEIAEKTLLDSYSILSKILYSTHQEMGKLCRKLIFCFTKLDKCNKCLPFSKQLLKVVQSNYEQFDVNVLNAALIVLYCWNYQPIDLDDPEYVQICEKIVKLCSKLFPTNSNIPQIILQKNDLVNKS